MDCAHLIAQGDHLFGKRGTLLSMWQECAEQFYPERADFTVVRTLGDSFADNLATSYPTLVRRDLGNSIGTMMRPTSLNWFSMVARREEIVDQPAKEWLEWASGVQKRAMYDRASMFVRASKEADHDIAAFGQAVKTVELNAQGDGLLYRCWHLRDVVWAEGAEGQIDTIHRKWNPTVATLCKTYRDKVHPKVAEKMFGARKTPFAEVNCRHVIIPAEECDHAYPGKGKVKWVEYMIDVDNKHVMEVTGLAYRKYVIPRWQTVSGSQYSFSPATVVALPEARLLQAMTRTLLEAGEKYTNPPMLAVQEAIRSDISIYAGGITWVDAEYDERLGEVLRPISQDKGGMPIGMDMQQSAMILLKEAFFLNKLDLPMNGPEMTAYEVGQRVQEYIRHTSPLFAPLEDEDNAAVCESTFELLLRHGAFGSVEDMPESLRGEEIKFKFESPLHEAVDRQKGQKFMEALAMMGNAIALDPTAPAHVNIATAFRDALGATGIPAKWIRSEEDAQAYIDAQAEEQQAAQLIEQMGAGAQVAKTMGEASQAIDPNVMAV